MFCCIGNLNFDTNKKIIIVSINAIIYHNKPLFLDKMISLYIIKPFPTENAYIIYEHEQLYK